MANILSEETEGRMIAFVRTVANRCHTCLHRNAENCKRCISSWANEIMKDYEIDLSRAGKDERYDFSIESRMRFIFKTIKESSRPLLSREIDTHDICTKQLKRKTLMLMCFIGVLSRVKRKVLNHYEYEYSVRDKGKEDGGAK